MATYQVIYRDGSQATFKSESMAAALEYTCIDFTNVIKIEEVNGRQKMLDMRSVNQEFHAFSCEYHTLGQIVNFVTDILITNGFEQVDLSSMGGKEGAIRCKHVGREVYLAITWYQMPSGKYEFVGYVS